jgi:hypothetical protein
LKTFVEGDEVWFFFTNYGSHCWGEEDTIIYPVNVEILTGKIVYINEDKDTIHVYVEGCRQVVNFGECYHRDYFFESKEKAINAMINYIQNL